MIRRRPTEEKTIADNAVAVIATTTETTIINQGQDQDRDLHLQCLLAMAATEDKKISLIDTTRMLVGTTIILAVAAITTTAVETRIIKRSTQMISRSNRCNHLPAAISIAISRRKLDDQTVKIERSRKLWARYHLLSHSLSLQLRQRTLKKSERLKPLLPSTIQSNQLA